MTKIFDFSMCIAIWIVEAIWGRDTNDEDEAVEAESIEAIVRRTAT